MGWYNGGAWDGLDGTEIPYVLAELANAVNERWDCLGKSRVAWTVNTGTEASPTVGTKSTNLSASDFFGLDMLGNDILEDISGHVGQLVSQSGVQSTTHCAGFAKTATNTAIDDDLWTLASIAADCGIAVPSGVTTIFDEAAANFLREALDRLLYPVIWPTNNVLEKDQDEGSGTRTYWFKGTDGSSVVNGTAADAFLNLAASTIDGQHLTTYDAYINLVASANSVGGHVYGCRSLTKSILEISPRYGSYPAVNGYPGSITKAWATYYAVYTDLAANVDFDVMGGAAILPPGSSGVFSESDKESIDVLTSNFSLTSATNPQVELPAFPATNPFNGTNAGASGIGTCIVLVVCKYDRDGVFGSISTNSGTQFTRIIIDISGEVADQA